MASKSERKEMDRRMDEDMKQAEMKRAFATVRNILNDKNRARIEKDYSSANLYNIINEALEYWLEVQDQEKV